MSLISVPNDHMIDTLPDAFAIITGGKTFPNISGIVKFYSMSYQGLVVYAELFHLPLHSTANSPSFYGFHIHENGDCSNNFANTGSHYNPDEQLHPNHVGDLPPLMSMDGYALMYVYAQQLNLEDIIGRSVIVHSKPEDFTTQPSGNSGDKIACGVIQPSLIP